MLTDAQASELALQVDAQLQAVRADPDANMRRVGEGPEGGETLPDAPAQRALIQTITGQPFESFWARYRRHLRRDLCLPGGMLHDQWQRYRDIESKAAVRVSYGWLAAMGIPTASLAPLAVAATVFLLNVVLKVGIDAICEGCVAEEPVAP
jgi:hypothetical protein